MIPPAALMTLEKCFCIMTTVGCDLRALAEVSLEGGIPNLCCHQWDLGEIKILMKTHGNPCWDYLGTVWATEVDVELSALALVPLSPHLTRKVTV